MKPWPALLLLPAIAYSAGNYTAEKITTQDVEIIRLTDAAHSVSVSIAPSIGNRAVAFTVHGKNILYFSVPDIATFRSRAARQLNGIPFLAPWANRMASGGFWADGKDYRFNGDVGTVHLDANGYRNSRHAYRFASLGSNRSGIGQPFRPRHQPPTILEASRPHGKLAVCARIRDDIHARER